MIVEVQCLPTPLGTPAEPYRHVDAAIAVLSAAGLPHEVGPLGTSVQGPPDAVWPLVRATHEACLASGAASVLTAIKVFQTADGAEPSMATLVAPHRP